MSTLGWRMTTRGPEVSESLGFKPRLCGDKLWQRPAWVRMLSTRYLDCAQFSTGLMVLSDKPHLHARIPNFYFGLSWRDDLQKLLKG